MSRSLWQEAVALCLASADEKDVVRMYAALRLGIPYAQVINSQRKRALTETFAYRYGVGKTTIREWLDK